MPAAREGRQVPYALRRVEIPEHPFFWTIDQLAIMLSLSIPEMRKRIAFTGRERNPKRLMRAINIAEASDKPDWRVSDREFHLWLARHDYKIERRS